MSSPQWKAPLHGWLMFKHATVEAWDWVQPVLLKVLMERAEFTHSTRSPSSSLAGSFATSRQGHQEQVLSVLQLTLIFTIPCQETNFGRILASAFFQWYALQRWLAHLVHRWLNLSLSAFGGKLTAFCWCLEGRSRMLNSDVHYPVSIDQSAALHLTFNFYLFLVERASHMHQNVLWHGALYMDSLFFFLTSVSGTRLRENHLLFRIWFKVHSKTCRVSVANWHLYHGVINNDCLFGYYVLCSECL